MGKPKHILVIRLSAMGDVAMSIPVLTAFIQEYPDVKITVLTRIFFAPFFTDLPNVSVFPAEVKGRHKGVLGLYKLSRELKKLNIDAVADLHNVLRSNILKCFLLGKKVVQIDKGRSEKKALVSGENFQQSFLEHKKLNTKCVNLLGAKASKWIGIAPFAAHEGKMYPLDLMREAIASLSEKYQIILFGGGQKEIEILNTFDNDFTNVVNVAGKLDLGEELDVISNLDVMLSMDSGNGHLAAMQGVKVISIWGVTHPYAGFAPFNQPEDYSLLADRNQYPLIPTSIYGNTYPEGYEKASGSIPPKTVIDKIEKILLLKPKT